MTGPVHKYTNPPPVPGFEPFEGVATIDLPAVLGYLGLAVTDENVDKLGAVLAVAHMAPYLVPGHDDDPQP